MERENIDKLITFLESYHGEDIPDNKRELIEYLVRLTQNDLDDLFGRLEETNISETVNESVYCKIKELIDYHGFENNNFLCLYSFLKNREIKSIKLSDMPLGKTFSLIDLCQERLNNNRVLVGDLINMNDIIRGNMRGKFEVLLAIMLHNGRLPDKKCNGDVLSGDETVEIKCTQSHGKPFSETNLMSGTGKIGIKDGEGFKSIDNVRQVLYEQYMGLPESLSMKNNEKMIDNFILNDFFSKEFVIHAYKDFFNNFFNGEALEFAIDKISDIIDYFTRDRSLDQMKIDKMIICPNQYRMFKRMMGCLYLCVYKKIQDFNHIIVTSYNALTNEDVSVFLNDEYLRLHPIDLYQKIEDSGLDFSWQGLDRKAGRRVMMGACVITS